MKTEPTRSQRRSFAPAFARIAHYAFWMFPVLCLTLYTANAATVVVYTNDFESYTNVATSLADEATDADPVGAEWNMADDTPLGAANGSGVQVINFTNSVGGPTKALLLRSSSQAQIRLFEARSGSRYQLDFWVYSVKTPPANRGWYLQVRGEGSDINGDDFLAYQSLRDSTANTIRYFDAVGPGAAAWVNTGLLHATNAWQHHRIVINPNALTFDVYLDDMVTPALTGGELSRCEIGVPTIIILHHEGNTADDGYAVIDDISFMVDDAIDLTTTFTEGFESYPARVSEDDDADPQGPWVTTEVDGTGQGRVRAPVKVQVVDSSVVTPHSGNKCLKLQYGQRAGASIAWGAPPESDVQITWWARVPASVAGTTANYLRMSLYGAEDGNTVAGDNALLGYGSRDATTGDATSLTYFVDAYGWIDSGVDYTPDTWEEYRLTTHANLGRYTLVKNPSTSPELIVDRARYVFGSASAWPKDWSPVFMAAWSSSNGTNHPPVYIDDIEIKAVAAEADPLPLPYTITFDGSRFTNVTQVDLYGAPVGGVAVDPRDNTTILFTVDALAPNGGIYRAQKLASGNWSLDPTPVLTGLDRPSGLVIETNGTIWWVHDNTMALMRLKWPWSSNTPELMINNFGNATTDDDPIDLTIAPPTFSGSRGSPGMIVIADRGSDVDANNALNLVDPTTTLVNQTNNNFLVNPTPGDLGGNLNAIAALPASGEVVTISEDGFLVAVNGDGTLRYINALNIWPLSGPNSGAGIAVDPLTGKIWGADDLKEELWSIDATSGVDQKEISFPSANPSWVSERQMDFHDPSLAFAPDGSFLAVMDTSTANGGGRLLIFHNEPFALPDFSISSVTRAAEGVNLVWQSAGVAKYDVLRGTDVGNGGSFQSIATNLTTTQFTDTNAPAGQAFYRVLARP